MIAGAQLITILQDKFFVDEKSCLEILTVILAVSTFTQKQTSDVFFYTVSKGRHSKQNDGFAQLKATE